MSLTPQGQQYNETLQIQPKDKADMLVYVCKIWTIHCLRNMCPVSLLKGERDTFLGT